MSITLQNVTDETLVLNIGIKGKAEPDYTAELRKYDETEIQDGFHVVVNKK